METKGFTISDIHRGLVEKEFSATEIVKGYLNKIESLDKKLGAFLEVFQEDALIQAKKVDDSIFRGDKIPVLAGIPAGVKDNILVKDKKCTAASKILENYLAPYDATVIEKLKGQGAVILGKTNMDEFAMGGSTENSAFKLTRNPYDFKRVPGGSSGGSAAAVASDECCFSLGSDTGGSIRQPASFCGVVGLKPTYGAVSRYGLIAFASSLDQIGPIAKTVEDAEIVFDVIEGKDPKDSTSVEFKSQIPNPKSQVKGLRIGIPKEYFGEGLDSGVRKVVEETIEKVEKEGAKIEEISLPQTKYAIPCYYIIATSEASANLARYEGIKYGRSNIKCQTSNLLDVYLKTREEGFGDEVKRRIMLGTYALSAGYYEAYYLRAQKVRTLIRKDFERAFQKVDFIFTPVSPTPAFKIGEKINDPLKMYLVDIFTVSVNLAGLPALSLPVGKVEVEKDKAGKNSASVGWLPVGLQIIGRPFRESEIFQIGKITEKLV
ncbi:Asp-tRNA(Asn)/Glu-tRNA(Gln) amidotransferase subunit GatA [bacterium]|nr:Asp-tRNA(Asn)/Glu-tRNA(Gln) amidotransferase subunit GatA [bacterium]